jgi:spore coat polysaccharide biosynthesis predicted glycosyltransferase SpsG
VRIIVTMGGSDPDDVTERAVRTLASLVSSEVVVRAICGPMYSGSLRNAPSEREKPIDVVVAPVSMGAELRNADMAVAAAGSTCWELAFLGIPSILVSIGEDQDANAMRMSAAGAAVAVSLDDDFDDRLLASVSQLLIDTGTREALGQRASALVDGRGAQRVVAAMRGAS